MLCCSDMLAPTSQGLAHKAFLLAQGAHPAWAGSGGSPGVGSGVGGALPRTVAQGPVWEAQLVPAAQETDQRAAEGLLSLVTRRLSLQATQVTSYIFLARYTHTAPSICQRTGRCDLLNVQKEQQICMWLRKGRVYQSTYTLRPLGLLLRSGGVTRRSHMEKWRRITDFLLRNNRGATESFGGWPSIPRHIWPLDNPVLQSMEAWTLKQMAESGLRYHMGLLELEAEKSQDHPVLGHGPQEEFRAPTPGH